VNHALHMYTNVGILEPLYLLATQMAMRKEREGIACNLFENRVVVPS
jgi:hypothetical protein